MCDRLLLKSHDNDKPLNATSVKARFVRTFNFGLEDVAARCHEGPVRGNSAAAIANPPDVQRGPKATAEIFITNVGLGVRLFRSRQSASDPIFAGPDVAVIPKSQPEGWPQTADKPLDVQVETFADVPHRRHART